LIDSVHFDVVQIFDPFGWSNSLRQVAELLRKWFIVLQAAGHCPNNQYYCLYGQFERG